MTFIIQSGISHLDSHLQKCSRSKVFARLDLCHWFWKIPLAKTSQEVMSIMPHIGMFSPTTIFQGGSDSGCYFQDVTRNV